jgi:hypothetical protein
LEDGYIKIHERLQATKKALSYGLNVILYTRATGFRTSELCNGLRQSPLNEEKADHFSSLTISDSQIFNVLVLMAVFEFNNCTARSLWADNAKPNRKPANGVDLPAQLTTA